MLHRAQKISLYRPSRKFVRQISLRQPARTKFRLTASISAPPQSRGHDRHRESSDTTATYFRSHLKQTQSSHRPVTTAPRSDPNRRKKSETRRLHSWASPIIDATAAQDTSCIPSATHPEKNPAVPSNSSPHSGFRAPPLLVLPSSARIHRSR